MVTRLLGSFRIKRAGVKAKMIESGFFPFQKRQENSIFLNKGGLLPCDRAIATAQRIFGTPERTVVEGGALENAVTGQRRW